MKRICFAQYARCLGAAVAIIVCTMGNMAQAQDAVRVLTIRSVYDGDTFRADVEGVDWPDPKGAPIRVSGIDTPEIKGACAFEIEHAIAARDETRALLASARQIELTNLRYDRYDRIVADVWIDGASLGAELFRRGHARVYNSGPRMSWCR